MAQIELTNVIKQFDGLKVVNDVSFTVQPGEFLALVGPSGCGKSTLLRMISGLETIDSGSIIIDDVEVNEIPPNERDIAMVFQNYALYPHMSVSENLSFGLKMKGVKKEVITGLVKKTAELLNITELLDRKPGQLSGGQKQRVAVGRAIVRNPKAFLFDEPLSNLDAKLRVKMRADLLKLHKKQNATSIYVTHDQSEAMTMADRIAIINSGVLQQLDTPIMVYQHPKNLFVAGFIGSPSMNFLTGAVTSNKSETIFSSSTGSITLKIPTDLIKDIPTSSLSKLVAGIRPEDILLNPQEKNLILLKNATIELIEQMGDVSLIYLCLEKGIEWVVKTPPSASMRIGQEIPLYLRANKLHFFDFATGENLFVHGRVPNL